MKEIVQSIFLIVTMLVLIIGASFLGYESYKYFAPKYRAVDNEVFKESNNTTMA